MGTAAVESAARAGLLAGGAGTFQRSGGGHLWPGLLDSRRPDADTTNGRQRAQRQRAFVSASADLSFSKFCAAGAMPDDPSAGQNPPYGAAISYYLKSAPAGDVKLLIQDAAGQTVRTINGTKNAGVNRVTWDLRTEQTKEVRLRTSPAYAPEIRNGAEGWRLAPDGPRSTVLMPPGNYTVKLTVVALSRSN